MIDDIAFKKNQMCSVWWDLPRDTNGLLDLYNSPFPIPQYIVRLPEIQM